VHPQATRARPARVQLFVLLLAATAGVHTALVPMHAHEAATVQIVFALSAAALFASALLVERTEGRVAVAVAAFLLAALLAAYVGTRVTVVWPFEHAEPVDPLGALTKLLEAAGLLLALGLLRTQADRPTRVPARPKELVP
jgi:hypothetical protein